MWGHGILLPSPPPAAAEAEGGGEPAWETPSGARGPWSRAHPQQSTPGSLCGPTAIPAPAHRAQCTPPGRHPRQTYLPQHRPENQVPQPPGEDLARFAEREALWGGTRHREKAGQRPGRRRHRGKGTWGQRRGRTPKSEARFQGLAALLLKQRGRERGTPPAELGGSTLPRPNQPAGPLRIYRKVVPLSPFPLPLLSLRNQGLLLRKLGSCSQGKGNSTLTQGFIL